MKEMFENIKNKWKSEIELINKKYPNTTYKGYYNLIESENGEVTEDCYLETDQEVSSFFGIGLQEFEYIRFRLNGITINKLESTEDDHGNWINDTYEIDLPEDFRTYIGKCKIDDHFI